MNAIIYIRVSSADQVENTSLENQEEACREWCEREGYAVAELFRDEGQSAKTADRPGLLRAVNYASKENVDAFVVWKIDRLSRNQNDYHQLRALLTTYDVKLCSATEALPDGPTGTLMESILAAFAQFSNDLRGERARCGMERALKAGGWVWQAPIGYANARTDDNQPTLEKDEVRAPLIRKGFELVASGAYSQSEVFEHLQELGLTKANGEPMKDTNFFRILKNPVYAGWITSDMAGPEPVKGQWDPIVSQELFDRVQVAIDADAPKENYQTDRPDFPLRRFIHCAECNNPLTGSWSTGRNKKYAYYRCYKCSAVNTRRHKLEDAFVDLLSRYRLKEEYADLFREIVLDAHRDRLKEAEKKRRVKSREVARLEQRKDRLLDLLIDGTIEEDMYRKRADKLNKRLVMARADRNAKEVKSMDLEAVLLFAKRILLEPGQMWLRANLKQRQRLQTLFFPDGIAWNGHKLEPPQTCELIRKLASSQACGDSHLTLVGPKGFEPLTNGL